jgi:glycerol-3-phosphate dehydrogenase
VRITRDDTARLIADLNSAFPAARLSPEDVLLVHRGLLPALRTRPAVKLLKSSIVRDHRQDGWSGALSVVGVRYTTARRTAQLAVDLAGSLLGHDARCRTATTPLTGGDIPAVSEFLASAEADEQHPFLPAARVRLARLYGTEWTRLSALARQDPHLAASLGTRCPTTGAELVFAAREEMALTLADAILRRTDAGSAGHPGRDALEHAAAVMGRELGWDAARQSQEIAAVERVYLVP